MKLRAGVAYNLYERTGDRAALEAALECYRDARGAWARAAEKARGVYVQDITFGSDKQLRGHWIDRLSAIDEDIVDMEKRLYEMQRVNVTSAETAIAEVQRRPRRPVFAAQHTPPGIFRPGQPLEIQISVDKIATVRLHYRHVNQAEAFQSVEMQARDNRYRALIPAEYTESPFPLQYYFELREGPKSVVLYPALEPPVWKQPYFIARKPV
jgi:hypothetical protein